MTCVYCQGTGRQRIGDHKYKDCPICTTPAAAVQPVGGCRQALEDLLTWFPEKPVHEWRIEAGEQGADDAIKAARAALANTPTQQAQGEAVGELVEAAGRYFQDYCLDEAEDVVAPDNSHGENTGASREQITAAKRLGEAVADMLASPLSGDYGVEVGGTQHAPESWVYVPREIVTNYMQSTHIPRHKRICEAALAAPPQQAQVAGDRVGAIAGGVAGLPAFWRMPEVSDEPLTEFDVGFKQAMDACAHDLEDELAASEQVAGDADAVGLSDLQLGRLSVVVMNAALLSLDADETFARMRAAITGAK